MTRACSFARPDRRGFLAAALGVVACATPVGAQSPWPDPVDPAVTLDDVEERVARVFPVQRIRCPELAWILSEGQAMLFDVREEEEHVFSHLDGSIQVMPETTPNAFMDQFHGFDGGKVPVFLCSVGIRSARLLHGLVSEMHDVPDSACYLSGGLFRWCAEGRTLVDEGGAPTTRVHGKDAQWGALLARLRSGRG